MEHELKTWPEYFQATWDGIKPFEVRKDDRGYEVGHRLHLREWNPQTEEYTGRNIGCLVTYILRGGAFGLPADVCVLGVADTHKWYGPAVAL